MLHLIHRYIHIMLLIPNKMPSITFVLVLFLAVLAKPTLQATTPSKPTYINFFCRPESGNCTQNSTYHRNLNTALPDLNSNSSLSSFYATSSDTVYGRYYCRQDLPLSTCSACVQAATVQIVFDCPDYKEALIWYEQCTLLYLNTTSRLDTIDVASPYDMWYTQKNVSDPKFKPVLEATMDQIINETAYGPGSSRFATAEAQVSAFEKLYSLAQCVPDRGFAVRAVSKKGPFYDVSSSPPAGAPPPLAIASPGVPPPANDSHQPTSTPLGNNAVARRYKSILKLCVALTVLLLGNKVILLYCLPVINTYNHYNSSSNDCESSYRQSCLIVVNSLFSEL